jgi:hypothetical protein
MSLEENDGLQKATFELDQYYDGPGNRAATVFRSNGVEVRIYVNGSNNEQYTYVPSGKKINWSQLSNGKTL